MRLSFLAAATALLVAGCSSSTDSSSVNPGVASDTTLVVDISPPMK